MGIPFDRVVELDAAAGHAVGTGWLVGPHLVLTARHVLDGDLPPVPLPAPPAVTAHWIAEQGLPAPARVRLLSRHDDQPLRPAAVVWWRDDVDVALLLCTDPDWPTPHGQILTRWSDLDEVTACAAIGFPAVQLIKASQGQAPVRDSQEIGALVRPGTMVKSHQWAVELSKASRTGPAGEAWAGFSGAGLLAEGLLIGIFRSDPDPDNAHGRELLAVPARVFADDPDLQAWVRADAGPGAWAQSGQTPAQMVEQRHADAAAGVHWPQQVGMVPALAPAYQPRPELTADLHHGAVATLQPGTATVLSGGPGCGKTQLAAAHATALRYTGQLDLLVWVTATTRPGILTQYAAAARAVDPRAAADDSDEDAAGRFLAWTQTTRHPWLIVLDDIPDPATVRDLWPQGAAGQVLATTQRTDAVITAGRAVVDVNVFTEEQAVAYLTTRRPGEPTDVARGLALALGCLPLALAQAAAYAQDRDLTLKAYLSRFEQRRLDLLFGPDTASDPTRTVTTTWSLAIERADELDPPGIATVLLVLLSVLAPTVPTTVLVTPPVTQGLRATVDDVHDALHNLRRVGLITVSTNPGAPPDVIRIHGLVQRVIREQLDDDALDDAVHVAAAALTAAWPDDDGRRTSAGLSMHLRGSVDELRRADRDHALWRPEGHPVMWLAGDSLIRAGLLQAAATYYTCLLREAVVNLGADHPDALSTGEDLARALQGAGRLAEALPLFKQTVADLERVFGPDHPNAVAGRNNLAVALLGTGRNAEALPLLERTVADRERISGSDHPDTLRSRNNLAVALLGAGRYAEALPLYERSLLDLEQVLGPDHPDTLTTRDNLAVALHLVGRLAEALPLLERTVTDRERVLGTDHPDTLHSRENLAVALQDAGRMAEALPLSERTVADRERVLGTDHPDTLASRVTLASAFQGTGHLTDAAPLFQRTLADLERVAGSDHPITLRSRLHFARALQAAGCLAAALPLLERSVVDFERVLGSDHPDTLRSREHLAVALRGASTSSTA